MGDKKVSLKDIEAQEAVERKEYLKNRFVEIVDQIYFKKEALRIFAAPFAFIYLVITEGK